VAFYESFGMFLKVQDFQEALTIFSKYQGLIKYQLKTTPINQTTPPSGKPII
jgi:hypothetical protein